MSKVIAPIDKNGRLVMPISFREAINVTNNSYVELVLEDDRIIVTKSDHVDVCAFCESNKELIKYKKNFLCKKCLQKFKKCDE